MERAREEPLGWIVTVATPPTGRGDATVDVYFVALPDQVDAIDAVRAIAGATQGVLITAHQEISKSLMAALSLKPGDTKVW
jgi:hypothetical protein